MDPSLRSGVSAVLAWRTLSRAAFIAVVVLGLCACQSSRPRDHLLNPKKAGTSLTMFGYTGGARVTAANRVDLEEGASQLETKLQGDINLGYAQPSVHADLRVMVLSIGASAGYRYGWHALQGLDYGPNKLSIDARVDKDEVDDILLDHWPWAEGRTRLVLPFHHNFLALTTVAYRFEDRLDRSFDWEFATVHDKGHLWRWETLMFLRHWNYGMIGPAVRFLNMSRDDERASELQYGIAGATMPAWTSTNDALVLRVYTAAGIENELMGQHIYRIPIQVIFGYQTEVAF